MKKQGKLANLLDQIEDCLNNQRHITEKVEFEKRLALLSRFTHLLEDEEQDFVLCAKLAFNQQLPWHNTTRY
ncbi:MAG TPA: hypothetical protein DHW71_00055 [Gammaproteobacteria bacterium]|nr:hypothetical protein [Gammaproteobacteria bacterium]|tara:strand:- start:4403 stop:4618 length:216 start_codon:yes stop_codon:yes gene_type:complete